MLQSRSWRRQTYQKVHFVRPTWELTEKDAEEAERTWCQKFDCRLLFGTEDRATQEALSLALTDANSNQADEPPIDGRPPSAPAGGGRPGLIIDQHSE